MLSTKAKKLMEAHRKYTLEEWKRRGANWLAKRYPGFSVPLALHLIQGVELDVELWILPSIKLFILREPRSEKSFFAVSRMQYAISKLLAKSASR